jgi:hypothetical protein
MTVEKVYYHEINEAISAVVRANCKLMGIDIVLRKCTEVQSTLATLLE